MAKKYGYLATIGADTSGLTAALKESDDAIRKTNTELREINKGLKIDPTNVELTSQKYTVLSKQLEITRTRMESLEKAQEDAAKSLSKEDYRAYTRELENARIKVEQLEKETKQLENTTKQSGDKVSDFGEKLKTIATAAKVGATAVAAIGSAAAAAGTAMVKVTTDTADYADNIDKASQKLGVSAEFYQEWEAVLQHSGTSMNNMSATFKTLANAAQDMSADQQAAFEKLGISIENVASLSTEDLFEQVISGLQQMEESTERTAIATDLLGRGAMEMGALLNTSAEDTQKMIDTVHDLGGVMSNEAIKAGADFKDSLQDLQTSFNGLKNNLAAEFLPSMVEAMDGLAAVFSGDSSGIEKAKEGIQNFIDELSKQLPQIADFGVKVISALAEGISDNLTDITDVAVDIIGELVTELISLAPTLMESAVEIINQLLGFLQENAYVIADGAVSIITSLVNGISDLLPDLIPATVDIVMQVVKGITDNAGELVAAAVQLITSLGAGLIDALPQLIGAAVEIPTTIADSIVNFDWGSVAESVINSLANSLDKLGKEFQVWLDNTFSGGTVYGGDIANVDSTGLVKGMRDNSKLVGEEIRKAQESYQTYYNMGKEIINQGQNDLAKAFEDGETIIGTSLTGQSYAKRYQNEANEIKKSGEKVVKVITTNGEKTAEATKKAAEKEKAAAEKAAKDAAKAEEDRQKAAIKAAEEAETERVNAIKASWDKVTAMKDRGKIDEAAEYKLKAQIVKEYCDENEATWDSYYKWLYDYTKKQEDKIADAQLKAWEDSSKKLADTLAESYKALKAQKEQVKKDLQSIDLTETVTDKDGNEVLVLKDLDAEIKKIDKLKASREKLKETGISDDLLAEIDKMNYADGSRQRYIDELLSLSPEKLQLYYDDWNKLREEQEKFAQDSIQDELDATNQAAADGVKDIFGNIPEAAYEDGIETARQYLQGIIDGMGDLDSAAALQLGGIADKTALQQNPKVKNVAEMVASGELIPSSSIVKFIINETEYIKTTVGEMFSKGQITGGSVFNY